MERRHGTGEFLETTRHLVYVIWHNPLIVVYMCRYDQFNPSHVHPVPFPPPCLSLLSSSRSLPSLVILPLFPSHLLSFTLGPHLPSSLPFPPIPSPPPSLSLRSPPLLPPFPSLPSPPPSLLPAPFFPSSPPAQFNMYPFPLSSPPSPLHQTLGQIGRVVKRLPSGDYQVAVCGRRWVYGPQCLQAAPGEDPPPDYQGPSSCSSVHRHSRIVNPLETMRNCQKKQKPCTNV